jgi:hypothetical protein
MRLPSHAHIMDISSSSAPAAFLSSSSMNCSGDLSPMSILDFSYTFFYCVRLSISGSSKSLSFSSDFLDSPL